MKGWILVNSASYKELPLTEEQLSNLGIEIVFCEDIDFIVDSHSDGTVLVKGGVTTLPDFVLAAFLLEDKYKPFAVLMQLESLGVICINNVNSLDLSKDKVKTSQVLASCGLPVPKTIYCNKNNINYNFIEQNIQYPMVVKIIDGTQGKGVFLVNNIKEAQDVISKMDTNDVIFQEYISTSFGSDIRVSFFVCKVVKIVGR